MVHHHNGAYAAGEVEDKVDAADSVNVEEMEDDIPGACNDGDVDRAVG